MTILEGHHHSSGLGLNNGLIENEDWTTKQNAGKMFNILYLNPGTYSSESIVAIRESGRYLISIYFSPFSA